MSCAGVPGSRLKVNATTHQTLAYTYNAASALGSHLAVLDSSGNAISRCEYDAFGQERVVLSGTRTSLRFAGRHGYYRDDSSGLNLLGARYYSARLGRFLTQDPTGHGGGLNLYDYCGGSPLTRHESTQRQDSYYLTMCP